VIIPIPFLGWIEIEENNDVEGLNKTAVKNNTPSSNDRGSNDSSTLETKSDEGTGSNL
jgi:hypothetical protein